MLEVVHVISGLQTGGAEMMLAKVLPGLKDRGLNGIVVSLSAVRGAIGAQIEAAGFAVHYLDLKHHPVAAIVELRKLVQHLRPAVIQGWLYHGNLAALFVAVTLGMSDKVAWAIRSSLYGNAHRRFGLKVAVWLNALLSRWPKVVLFNAKVSQQQHEAYGFRPRRSELVDNGFDGDRFKPDASARATLRTELGLPDTATLIGCVGRLHPDKDHANLFSAVPLVSAAGGDGEVYYVMIGKGLEVGSPAVALLTEPVKARLKLLGERHDLHRLMPAFDVLVLPSKTEAFPNVLGEAMACGVPCVATDVGESAAIIGDTGLVVHPQDPKALAAALVKMLRMRKSDRTNLGNRARQRVLSAYGLDAAIDKISAIYRQL